MVVTPYVVHFRADLPNQTPNLANYRPVNATNIHFKSKTFF